MPRLQEMSQQAPLFIAVEGIDGTGKSTQISAVAEFLGELGYSVRTTRDPGSSEIGSQIRSLLLNSELSMHRRTEALLFMASRCEMVESFIRPSIDAGHSVISDRFLLSNVVYQSIGEGGQTAVASDVLWKLGQMANAQLRPDLTILLDLPAASALERMGDRNHDRMEKRGVAYLEEVRQTYLRELSASSESTMVIDASLPIDEVTVRIRTKLQAWLDTNETS